MSVLIMIQAFRPGFVAGTCYDLYWKSPNSFYKGKDKQSHGHISVLATTCFLYTTAAAETWGQNCKGLSRRAQLS